MNEQGKAVEPAVAAAATLTGFFALRAWRSGAGIVTTLLVLSSIFAISFAIAYVGRRLGLKSSSEAPMFDFSATRRGRTMLWAIVGLVLLFVSVLIFAE